MKTQRSLSKCLLLAALSGLVGSPLSAAVLMLDFGPQTVSLADSTNSPYHTAESSFTGVTWNQVQVSDVPSGLFWSDGSAATGLSLNIGATTSGTQTILGLGNTPSGNSLLGSNTSSGVYGGTSVGKDGIFTGSSGVRYVGFQLGGLAAGTYEIYVAARNTNAGASTSYGQVLYAGASSTSGDFNATSLSDTTSVSFTGASDATSAWVESDNYMKLSVTLTSGQYLNLAVTGSGSELRGFLNSVQIVSVPEPSVSLLLASAGMVLTIVRRRR